MVQSEGTRSVGDQDDKEATLSGRIVLQRVSAGGFGHEGRLEE